MEQEFRKEERNRELRFDRRVARIMAAIYNNNPGKPRWRTYSEGQFLPRLRTSANQSEANLRAKIMTLHHVLTVIG